MANIQMNDVGEISAIDRVMNSLVPGSSVLHKGVADLSLLNAKRVAKENGLDPGKAAAAQKKFNDLTLQKGTADLLKTEVLGIKIPFLNAMVAAPAGKIDKEYGRAYNELQVALGKADELGRVADRNKAYTEPSLNPVTGLLEFDPNGLAIVTAGFEKAGTDPALAEAKIAELTTQRLANQELVNLWNSGQIPQEFIRLGRTPLETAQLFSNTQGMQAQNKFMADQAQKEAVLQGRQEQSLSPAQQTSNFLAAQGKPNITESNVPVDNPLLSSAVTQAGQSSPRAFANKLAEAQNVKTQALQNNTVNSALETPTPTTAQSVAVPPSGAPASFAPNNFNPAPNFSAATPEQLALIKRGKFV